MRLTKGTLAIAIVAALAMSVTVVGATAGASGEHAVAAKKKCKKKKKKQADSAKKKKKCKKKKKKKGTTAPISMVRATLTWSDGGNNTDYNLYVFEGASSGRAGSDPIASTSFSANAIGTSGTETFTDLDFGQHRAFAFGVCKQDGGTDGSSYTIDYVTADGVHHTDTQSNHDDGYAARYDGPPPPTAPNGFAPCPVP